MDVLVEELEKIQDDSSWKYLLSGEQEKDWFSGYATAVSDVLELITILNRGRD